MGLPTLSDSINREIHMKILSITAQKPHSTGSGFYLTELVKGMAEMGHEQAVVGGVYESDIVDFPEGVRFYPVCFCTKRLPFPIPGMSDEMPYASTVYGTMTDKMVEQFGQAFEERVREAVQVLKPDVIVCHHLYLLTAMVRRWYPDKPIIGICHGTDLRQMKKIPLGRELISREIQNLDFLLALQENQMEEIQRVYKVSAEKLSVIGAGYNHHIFYQPKSEREARPIRITFAGKIAEKKGVHCLVKAVSRLAYKKEDIILSLAGGCGNEKEYNRIVELSRQCPYKVEFPGLLCQEELAALLNRSHLFVLPSFYEGLPLVLLEAMACGAKVICTDLPGVKQWLDLNLEGHGVIFVEPPVMKNTDEAVELFLPEFEERLKVAIEKQLKEPLRAADHEIEKLSWKGICGKLNLIIENINK